MRFTTSSQFLGDLIKLKANDSIKRIKVVGNILTFQTAFRDIELKLNNEYREIRMNQNSASWWNITSILRRIEDQPVILDIEENKVLLIFEF